MQCESQQVIVKWNALYCALNHATSHSAVQIFTTCAFIDLLNGYKLLFLSDHVCFTVANVVQFAWNVHTACDVVCTYTSISILMVLFFQSELQDARDELKEKAELVETRGDELKILHGKLVDSEEQVKNDQQRKIAEWNTLQESYRKVSLSIHSI